MKNIIIVGAGLAGMSAALQASQYDCHITLISSYPSERAQSVMAEGGINAVLNTKGEEDSVEEHYDDTMRAGCDLADAKAVWDMVNAAPKIVNKLYRMGVCFNTAGIDQIDLRNFGGQKKKRTAFCDSETGKQIMTVLIDAIRELEIKGKVTRLSHHSFKGLILDGACYGCIAEDQYHHEIIKLSGSVIMATGGPHGLFGDTTGSLANTGEAAAVLFSQGVSFANLEMIQYHPTTVEMGTKRMLISEAGRSEGGRLFVYKDDQPYYFMEEKYPKLGNLMPRDITSREIYKTSQMGDVYLDMTHLSEEVYENKLSVLADDCKTYLHEDIRKTPIKVFPGIHYFMGGIYVDIHHHTSIKNLYAAGECCAQYHGANRLGGNSLLGAIYGGLLAGEYAAKECTDEENKEIEPMLMDDSISVSDKKRLNKIMLKGLGVIRKETELNKGLEQLKTMNSILSLFGQAFFMSALARKESRGAHYREDYPKRNDEKYQSTSVASYDGSDIHICFKKVNTRR